MGRRGQLRLQLADTGFENKDAGVAGGDEIVQPQNLRGIGFIIRHRSITLRHCVVAFLLDEVEFTLDGNETGVSFVALASSLVSFLGAGAYIHL